jgi:tetratricopeptide (TPR) repeat protein
MSNDSLYCIKAQKDPIAWSIYQHLQKNYQQSDKDFDRGFVETYFHKGPTPVQKLVSVNNGTICSQEVYNHALSFSEKNQKFAEWLKTKKKIEIPWLNPPLTLKNKFLKYFTKAKAEIEKKNLGTAERSIEIAKVIAHFIGDDEVGLGVRYEFDKKTKVRLPEDTAKDQLANCLDYVILFLALAKIANEKIEVLYVSKSKFNGAVKSINHVVIGVKNKGAQKKSFTIFDIDPRAKSNQIIEYFPISSRVLLSQILTDQGYLNNPFNSETNLQKFTTYSLNHLFSGLKLDPNNPFILDQLVHAYGKSKQFLKALPISQMLVKRYPTYPKGFLTLAHVYKDIGHYRLALQAYKIYDKMKQK